ncbi:MAG: hypothetical protein AAB601_00080 [Patescibacteria group bacterium]
MNWKKGIGYGALIWVIMFAVLSALMAFAGAGVTLSIAAIVLGVILAFVFAGKVDLSSVGTALGYGVLWAVVGLVLDLIVTMQFAPDLFSDWLYWVGYVLLAATPAVKKIAVKPEAPTPPMVPSSPVR